MRHLTELVSLDGMLNEALVEPEYDDADDWHYIHTDGEYITGFFTLAAVRNERGKIQNMLNERGKHEKKQ